LWEFSGVCHFASKAVYLNHRVDYDKLETIKGGNPVCNTC
jgi:hypothetical protein